jgi:hypothetical protein
MNDKKEKCYYCQNEALYNQLIPEELSVAGVCKKHLLSYAP